MFFFLFCLSEFFNGGRNIILRALFNSVTFKFEENIENEIKEIASIQLLKFQEENIETN